MRFISCCSGIEGATVALGPLGFEPVAYAEVDEFASAVLAERFPETPNVGDFTTHDWSQYRGTVDLAIAGVPCQSFSTAGLREGVAGDRGRLYLEFLRAAKDAGCRWVVVENVPGLLSVHGGRDFESILETVAGLWPDGGACWRLLDAAYFGVPQRRRRVYLVIESTDWRRAAAVLGDGEMCDGVDPQDGRSWEDLARRSGLYAEGYCLASPQANAELISGGLSTTLTLLHEPPLWVHRDGGSWVAERLSPEDYEACQGFPTGWTRIPWHGRPAERCPSNRRYAALGNSFATPVIRWIGRRILEVEELSPHDGKRE